MEKRYLLLGAIILLFISGCEEDSAEPPLPVDDIDHGYETQVFSDNDKLGGITETNYQEEILDFLESDYSINPQDLELERVVDKNDKKFVYFTQRYKRVPVYNSRSVFFIRDRKLSFMKLNYYDIDKLNIVPSLNAEEALMLPKEDLLSKKYEINTLEEDSLDGLKNMDSFSLEENSEKVRGYYDIIGNFREYDFSRLDDRQIKSLISRSIDLTIYPYKEKYHLVYKVDLPLIEELPAQFSYFVDANTGKILDIKDNLIYYGVSGTVTGLEWEDPFTDGIQLEKEFMHNYVSINQEQVQSDETGFYFIDNLEGTNNLISYLQGPWVSVYNDQLDESEHSFLVSDETVHDWNWDSDDTSYLDEESNVFYHTNRIHDYAVFIGADEMNFNMEANVNINDHCNAYYSSGGPSINFFEASQSCESTGVINDVVLHEYGHGIVHKLNPTMFDLYGYGEAGNANEAIADYFACTINDNPDQGEGFFIGNPDPLRICNSDDVYPDDYDPEPHSGCQILSGALWDVREILGKDYLDPLIVDALRLQPINYQEILESLLVMDDNNDNLEDGTPNILTICDSFYSHGIYSGYCAGYTNDPIAIIDYPVDGEIISGEIDILGTAAPSEGSELSEYILSLTNSGGEEIELFSSSEVIINSILFENWVIGAFDDGVYTLNLQVSDTSGKQSTTSVLIAMFNDISTNNPRNGDVQRLGSILDINGSILINYDNYLVEYSISNQDEWHDEGITLFGNGDSPFEDLVLAEWDTSLLNEGFYDIKIVLSYGDKQQIEYIEDIYFDPSLKEGFPIFVNHLYNDDGRNINNNMEFSTSDLDEDDLNEIIVVMPGNKGLLKVYNSDGSLKWQTYLTDNDIPQYSNTYYHSLIEDLNNDGYREIIINHIDLPCDNWGLCQPKISVFNHLGEKINQFDLTTSRTEVSLTSADFNDNGDMEVIAFDEKTSYYYEDGEFDFGSENLNIFDNDGNLIYHNNTPFINMLQVFSFSPSGPAVGNFDEDSDLELVTIVPIWNLTTLEPDNGLSFTIYNMDGTIVSHWVAFPDDIAHFYTKPSVGDIDDDGYDDIVVGLIELWPWMNPKKGVYVFDRNGNILPGWPSLNTNSFLSSPALADIDNDEYLEVVISAQYTKETYILNHDGSIVAGWPKYHSYANYYSPIIADVDGDNNLDVLVGVYEGIYHSGGIFAWDYQGNILDDFPKVTEYRVIAPVEVIDLDSDSVLELIATSNGNIDVFDFPYYLDKERGSIYAWELDSSYLNEESSWFLYQNNLGRNGYLYYGLYKEDSSNKLKNPSFEIDDGTDYYPDWTGDDITPNNNIPDGWRIRYGCLPDNCNYDLDTSEKQSGVKSFKLDVENDNSFGYQDVPISRGKTYEVLGYIKTDCEDCFGTILTECIDENHENIWVGCSLNKDSDDFINFYGQTDWTKDEFYVTANNPNAKYLRVICYNSPNEQGTGSVWCDSFKVEEMPKPPEEPNIQIARPTELILPKEMQEEQKLEEKQSLSPLRTFWQKILNILF